MVTLFIIFVLKVSESHMDKLLDRVHDLNPDSPMLKYFPGRSLEVEVLFNVDANLTKISRQQNAIDVTIAAHTPREIDYISVKQRVTLGCEVKEVEEVMSFLSSFPKDSLYRVKGFFWLRSKTSNSRVLYAIDCAFSRVGVIKCIESGSGDKVLDAHSDINIDCTLVGRELAMYVERRFCTFFHLQPSDMT